MKNRYTVLGMIIIIFIIFVVEYNKQSDLENNKKNTLGKIIRLQPSFKIRYTIEYEYHVEGKSYIGAVRVTPFKCDDGTKYCIGSEFKVYYSSKNPEYSRIDLGKYEKYKTKLEFFK